MSEENLDSSEVVDEVVEEQVNTGNSDAEAKEETVAETKQEASADESENQNDGSETPKEFTYDELLEKLKTAEDKANENWDLALRAKAEMENVRRRSDKDIASARKFGLEKIANEILPVKDSLDLGIKAAKEMASEDESVNKVIEGMEMTLQQMNSAMDKVGIKDVDPQEGDKFSPDFHQAMSMLEMEGKESNTIVSVFQKGYTLNDRLLRPAMVVVAK